jgi:hypothetical protein
MPTIKEVLKEFVATANAGQYATESELLSKFPELNGYDPNTLKEFVATANAGQYASEDELLSKFPEFGQPVKKKEEPQVLPWNQKPAPPKPKQEPALPFLESKPSGISLGSQRVPETAPMFEAPPMRTPEEAQAIVEAPEYKEEQFFTGTFGELLKNVDDPLSPTSWLGLGDFIDDFGRAVAQGSNTGDIMSPTSSIFLNGSKTSDEEITKFRKAVELASKLGPSDEMVSFSKEYQESGKDVTGFLKALAMNPGAIPEIMVSSYSAMVNAPSLKAGGAVIGTAAAGGAATAGPAGAAAAALASVPYAMAAMGATLETNATLGESIKEKLAQDGLEWNDENIKSVISDEKFLRDARIKAVTRGVTIGAIDALTGRVAGKVGAKLIKAPKAGVAKAGLAAGGIEAVGGSTGEATARALTGQEMDIAEIGLEGIAELPGTIVSVGSEVLKKPLYKVNGEIRPEADVKEIVETADGDQLAKINIEITNDTKGYNEQIQEKVVSAQVKNEVKEVNPDLDEETTNEITRLEMELKKVEGKKTQSAKDKAASIRSQIKTLQENAVQKPSTEEGVLRPEESQVGLQEVGEGDAKEQAPAQEVVKEEVNAGSTIKWDVYGNEDEGDWTIEKETTTRGGEKAVELSKVYVEDSTNGKSYTKEYADKNGIKYDNERTITYVVPLSELGNLQQAPTEEDLQAALDRIEIPEDTEALPGVDELLKTINESIGRVKEEVDKNKDEQTLQDLSDKVARAKKNIATADDTDVAIEEFKQAEKEKTDFEEAVSKKKNFNKVEALIADEIYQKDRGGYEYQELFDQDPRLAAIQSAKEMIELGKGDFLDEEGVARYENDIKILEEDIAKFPVKQAVSPATPAVEAIDSSTRSDVEIEKRMSEIEGDNKYTDEFNSLEKEMEKRERATIFNVPLEKVNDAVDVLIQKEKDKPNGFGTFVEKGDAIETKKVADRYLNAKKLTDAELMKDFSDAVRGNPTTSYADGLKMREALNEATNRGIDTEAMLADVTKVYTDAGYDIETAKSVVAGMLKPVFKGSKKVSSKTPKAKSVPIPVAIPKPAPTPAPVPAPAPSAVVSQPTTKAIGPEALRQEYINKIAEVTLNQDKSRTPKQIEERKKELQAEYNKLKAEMTAPKPKAEAKPAPKKAAPAPKVEAKPTPKAEAKAEPVVSKKDQEAIKQLESEIEYQDRQIEDAIEEIGNTKYNLKEALAEIKKKRDALKGQKMSAEARAEANEELDAEIEDAKEEHDTYLEEYNDQLSEAKKEKKKAETKLAKLQSKSATPVSVVQEEEPSYDDIKDLDPTNETNLKKMLRKFDSMDNELADFGRGNLSSGIAIPLARAIIKSLKVLVKAGIRIEDAIKRVATQNNLEEKDIVKMIKEIDNAQTAMKKLKDQIKAEARAALDAKKDLNQKRKDLSNVIKDMQASGKISVVKARAILNKIGKVNLSNNVSVEEFIKYVNKIFSDAEYESKLTTAKETRSQIRALSKNKDKFANLRDLGSKFAEIDPSMVEDIDEYNKVASLIKDSIKGSTTRKADVKLVSTIKESDAMDYINKTMEAQREILLNQKAEEVQDLLGIDASDLTYEELMELADDDKPLTKYNEGLIRTAINKAFNVYSSLISESIRNGKDVFTGEDVQYTANQKRVVKDFMSMDLSILSPKQSIEAVDALMNFLQNQSIAKMDSVLAKYKGETEMRAIEKKGIKAKPVRKYWSKGLGRLLLEQTANLPIVFERMFGGFTRGGMVEDAMGITALKNGKSKAQSESNKIVDEYVDKFYKLKPNGEVFNTAFNNIERGMVAFMSRNVIGTDSEIKAEFKRRRDLIEQSTTELEKGNEKEVAKAKVYQEVYDKILKDSDNIEQVQGKAAPENLEAVKFWQDKWADKYEQLYDTALGVYNKKLEKDMNYSMPDRFSKLSSDTGKIDITTEDMGFLVNNGTAPLYKKETGVLMAATRPESLPRNKNTSKTNRYIDLSFDNINSNSMYDALVDINTAAPIRQVQSALNSDSFSKIMKGTGDEQLITNRIDLYVRNIRNKNPFSNDEFSKSVKSLNRIASIGVGQALGGVLQPITQVIPIATNTLVNSGSLDVQSTFDPAKQAFMNNSGYAIGNRGVESQAQIESLNKMIEEAASSKPEKAFREIEKANNWWLKNFLVKFDVIIARASWMTYYEQSLKEQGIDPATIDYNTHEINEKAANYAQRQVDRQQNISDPDLAGALLSDKDAGKQLFVKVLMPFASFRMNQSARFGADLATVTNKTATKEDKEIAYRSLFGFAAEMATFRLLSAGSALLIAAAVKGIMGRGDDEEKEKKKNDAIIKGQLTSTVADIFSPAPLIDKAVQMGASAVLDATQDALDVSDEEKLEIYSGNKQDFFQSLGLLGITGSRVSQLYEMSKLAAGASYEDDYGRKKYLSPEDRKAIATLIPIAIVSNIGLTPSEVNKIVRSSISDAKRNASTVEGGQSKVDTKIMGLNKEDLKRYYPEVYEEYYGEGTEDAERRKLEQEENKLEREMKDEEYDYKPEDKKSGGFSTGGFGSGK